MTNADGNYRLLISRSWVRIPPGRKSRSSAVEQDVPIDPCRHDRNCSGECRTELQPPTLGWSGKVRLLPLAALSGTSGAILVSSILVAAANELSSANADRTTGSALPPRGVKRPDVQIIPRFSKRVAQENVLSQPRRRGSGIPPANAGRTTRKEHSLACDGRGRVFESSRLR